MVGINWHLFLLIWDLIISIILFYNFFYFPGMGLPWISDARILTKFLELGEEIKKNTTEI